jgi:flagellum-specific peptidoglycan hydrolase FlgJ
VTVSTGGVITGFNFIPGAAATMTSPTSVPLHLLALEQAARPGAPGDLAVGGDSAGRVTSDAQLRAAIVNVAGYYLRLAQTRTPAQIEALIWDNTSSDGADHGPSCAAFASLTLELAAQAVGQQSWVTGGTTYPWPMPAWADVRVDTNPASTGITSMVADAQAGGRWHPLGDGYQPQPGDWAVYNGHVEVVTRYTGGVLDTIGADSLPDLSVNAHSSDAPLAEQGVAGFVDNGNLKPAPGTLGASAQQQAPTGAGAPGPVTPGPTRDSAAIPGLPGASALSGTGGIPAASVAARSGTLTGTGVDASVPGLPPARAAQPATDATGTAAIPGASPAVTAPVSPSARRPASPATGSAGSVGADPAAAPPAAHGAPAAGSPTAKPGATSSASAGRQYAAPGTREQQAFISLVAPGAVAAQQRYGVPAAVTIAQAIEESAWGQSGLAAQYHNLFGIKGTGPAGSATLPTQEYEGGQWVTTGAQFRVYHNDAESIADHAELLATSGYYMRAMADRAVPDAFANDLTGVYATDPDYGANLIALMKLYNLYQYNPATAPATSPAPDATPAPAPSASPTTTGAPAPPGHPAASPASSAPAAPAGRPGSGQSGQARTWHADVPGVAAPTLAPAAPVATSAASPAASTGQIPGLVSPGALTPAATGPVHVTAPTPTAAGKPAASGSPVSGVPVPPGQTTGSAGASIPGIVAPGTGTTAVTAATQAGTGTSGVVTTALVTPALVPRGRAASARASTPRVATGATRYEARLPHAVTTALFASAKAPLARGEHLYRDVAACTGGSWKLLAAVDWMQCKADPRYSPVQGEKLGSLNDDGTSYSTKSAALTQCARDLIELASAVYGIDLAARRPLSVRELAAAFAAFRWGAILRRRGVSPMEFPYSVAGLTAAHQKMHWPAIDAPDAPDRPGGRFREPFGAVPVLLSLGYPATV